MTLQEAQKYGRTKTLKATGLIVAVLLVVLMILETSGDFANGILLFMQAIANMHFIAILTIIFGLTFVFGGKAGKEIIVNKKNFVLASFKYSVLIILTIIIYAAVVGITKDKSTSTDNFTRLSTTYFLIPLAKTGSLSIIPTLAIWLWATNQMRLKIHYRTE